MTKDGFRVPTGDRDLANSFYDEINNGYEYDHGNASVKPGDRVLDCGAYVGMFTDYAYRRGASKVYSVEADKYRFECLYENINNIWKTYPDSILNKSEYPELFNRYVTDRMTNVETDFDINDFLETHYIDFVKMDIEGSEWPVLLNMKDSNMKSVKKWAIEVHLGWSKDSRMFPYGDKFSRDFNEHYATKLIRVIEKFTYNGFVTAFKHIHTEYDVAMLYAWK